MFPRDITNNVVWKDKKKQKMPGRPSSPSDEYSGKLELDVKNSTLNDRSKRYADGGPFILCYI